MKLDELLSEQRMRGMIWAESTEWTRASAKISPEIHAYELKLMRQAALEAAENAFRLAAKACRDIDAHYREPKDALFCGAAILEIAKELE